MPDPTFHFIVVVDIEGFGKRTIPLQESLSAAMYEVVATAFGDVGVDWQSVVKLDRGDGILMLVPVSANSVTLAGRFVDALNEGLREKSRMFSAEHQMRMRVALHQGNCHQNANGWIGEAINTASRLVDSAGLRAALAAATTATMAFIVSDEIYRGVIRHGYRHIDPAAFAPVDIEVKELHERAWIQVPGYPFPPGVTPAAGPQAPPAATAAPTPAPTPAAPTGGGAIFHNAGAMNGDQFLGDKVMGDKFTGDKTVYGGR
jgi:class 3 adenylate cyclase